MIKNLALALTTVSLLVAPVLADKVPDAPSEDAARQVAKDFLDAIGRRDEAAAKKLVMSPADCEDMMAATGSTAAADLTKCRTFTKDLAATAVALYEKKVAKGFETDKLEVERDAKHSIAYVVATGKGGSPELDVAVMATGKRAVVYVAQVRAK
jgi:putative N-acetylmannosamine-6-phosphate epimerase